MKLSPIFPRILGLLAFFSPVISGADIPRQCHVEVFRMPLEDWNRIDPAIRDDHAKLYEKCRSAAERGKIDDSDRIGGAIGAEKCAFESTSELSYPTGFSASGNMLMPAGWETRNTGSSLECNWGGGNNRVESQIYYDLVTVAHWRPTIAEGAADNIKLSEVPIFDCVRLSADHMGSKLEGLSLLGVVPVPAAGEKAAQLALAFAKVNFPITPAEPMDSGVQLEILVLRGPVGGGDGDPSTRIKTLLARPGAVETDISASTRTGGKAQAESVTEWIYPTKAARPREVLVPMRFETLNQGTTLQFECSSAATAACEVRFRFEYDLRKPLIPAANGEGTALVTPEKSTLYRFSLDERMILVPGAWTAVREVPLEPILGALDDSAKLQSCYVFARVLRIGGF